MAATPNILVGNVVSVSVAGALMYAKSGKVERSRKKIDVTNSRSAGYQQLKAGNRSASGDATCVYNGDDPPVIVEGTEVSIVYTVTGGKTFTIQALVEKVTDSFVTDGEYTYMFSWDSSGAYSVT